LSVSSDHESLVPGPPEEFGALQTLLLQHNNTVD